MSDLRSSAALTAIIVLLSACSWAGSTASDDDRPVSAPPSSVTSTSEVHALTGLVRDSRGNPVQGALVTLKPAENPGHAVPDLAVMTDETGRYRWPAVLQVGRYEVGVRTEQGAASTTVTIRSSATTSADLTLSR